MIYSIKYLERGLIHKGFYNKCNTANEEKFTTNIRKKWTNNKYTK